MDKPYISDQAYAQFLREEKIMGSQCGTCGILAVPPRSICGDCHQTQLNWIEFKGRGTLAAFTFIAIGAPFMIAQGYDRNNPYCTAVIKLDEGPRIVARLEEVDATQPESLQIGVVVQAKFLHYKAASESKTSLVFTLV